MNNLAFLVTTFLRDKLLYQCIDTLVKYYPDYYIIVADQGHFTKEKDNYFDRLEFKNNTKAKRQYYKLEYDCGLCKARNFLVEKAYESNCNFVFLIADSIIFERNYDKEIQIVLEFLNQEEKRALVGFELVGRVKYEYDIELIKGKYFLLKTPKESPIVYKNIKFLPVSITRNFFIAKIECLLDCKCPEELKLCEHELWHYIMKEKGWLKFYSNCIQAKYINYKPKEYLEMRNRLYTVYRKKLQEICKIENWIKIER